MCFAIHFQYGRTIALIIVAQYIRRTRTDFWSLSFLVPFRQITIFASNFHKRLLIETSFGFIQNLDFFIFFESFTESNIFGSLFLSTFSIFIRYSYFVHAWLILRHLKLWTPIFKIEFSNFFLNCLAFENLIHEIVWKQRVVEILDIGERNNFKTVKNCICWVKKRFCII